MKPRLTMSPRTGPGGMPGPGVDRWVCRTRALQYQMTRQVCHPPVDPCHECRHQAGIRAIAEESQLTASKDCEKFSVTPPSEFHLPETLARAVVLAWR